MKYKFKRSLRKLALISTPWPLYSRPSIQLATLKAFLQTRVSGLQVDAFHFYLALANTIGYRLYHEISERTWLSESVYAALLYPERFNQAARLFARETAGKSFLRNIEFGALTGRVQKATADFLSSQNWGAFGLLGFSISLCQLTSALYVIRHIKKAHPEQLIVVGGASTCGDAARGMLQNFPEIDVVVNGEGELPFSQLIETLRRSPNLSAVSDIQGVVTRAEDAGKSTTPSFLQIETLGDLPPPNFDDYFNLLQTFEARKTFFATLPVEISRGCWWKRTVESGSAGGCAFCNLNVQWQGYRFKSPHQVASEIDNLSSRHQTLSVAIADNVLPKKGSQAIFRQIGTLNKDLRLFGEVRATTPLKELRTLQACGMRQVQIGIEALSTRLLKKLQKGTTAIQNLEIMRNCETLGIKNISNLILQFPGSDAQDVAETLRTLAYALPYHPLKAVRFWLGLGSPVWQNPKKYGILAVFNHPNWSYLFPAQIYRSFAFMIQAYRGDRTYQKKIWQPVKKKITEWQKQYCAIHKQPGHSPILSYQDGRDFIIIHQRRFRTEPLTHRLMGSSRLIYLFCQKHRSFKRIRREFSAVTADKILKFLKMMVDKKLMFEEKDKYLSLAGPVG